MVFNFNVCSVQTKLSAVQHRVFNLNLDVFAEQTKLYAVQVRLGVLQVHAVQPRHRRGSHQVERYFIIHIKPPNANQQRIKNFPLHLKKQHVFYISLTAQDPIVLVEDHGLLPLLHGVVFARPY